MFSFCAHNMNTGEPGRAGRRGFSLIELLVVVAIIGLLISITMPSLAKVRIQASRTKCKSNLKQIGSGILEYLNVHDDRYFYAAELPSREEEVAEADGRDPYLPIYEALKAELGGESKVYHCPADRNTMSPELGGRTYFETEKTSYEWRSQYNGKKVERDDLSRAIGAADAPMMYDYEPFHGGERARNSLVTLYADLHVQSGQWEPE